MKTHNAQGAMHNLARFWLLLGVAALAVAGLFALVLVVARTPQLAAFGDIFHASLVVHVDLSVLVWFLTIAGMIWSVEAAKCRSWLRIPLIEEAALTAMAAGAALLALSPLFGGEALMSNYIPVIANPVFFLGLALILCGFGLMLLHVLLKRPGDSPIAFAAYSAALVGAMALLAFVWSYLRMPHVITGQQYYDMLFWAGGHILQNTHSIFAMLGWLLLAQALRPGLKTTWATAWPFYLGLWIAFGASAAGFLYQIYNHDPAAQDFRLFFTRYAMAFGGFGPALAGIWIITKISLPSAKERALFSALIMSLLLFFYGGAIGLWIHGEDVTVPAHYHGSIVGITLAFMGLAYLWLPRFGYGEVAHMRLAFWQPIVYGGGQILHISGLAWSGGYGVLRKTPGGLDALPVGVKAAMGMMGMGGMLAIIGGFMFVIVVAKSVLKARTISA